MNIISRSELMRVQRYTTFAEARNSLTTKKAKLSPSKPTVFLSHSHLDDTLVLNAVGLLERFGCDVYVDWMDHGMPDKTNAKTAEIIREKIRTTSRLVLLASPRALESRWVPWELGYADAINGLRQVAILPVRDDATSNYPGNEYLHIYPTIQTDDKGTPVVAFPGEPIGASLDYWLGELCGKVLYGPPMPIHLAE